MGLSPAALLVDSSGNIVAVTNDGGTYRLGTISKLLDSGGAQIDPAEDGTLQTMDGRLVTIDSVLDSIKDVDGIKQIVDPLPSGTNEIGRVRAFLYDDVNNVALPVIDDTAIPSNTRGIVVAGKSYDGKAYFLQITDEGRAAVTSYPPTAPPGTTAFVIDASSPLVVGPNPIYQETNGAIVAADTDVHVQFIASGAAGDPSENGSMVEVYWEEGVGPTRHLVERVFVSGATVSLVLPDTRLARDGTAMVGNGTNTRLVVRRERLSNSGQEIDAVVRGYTESV